MYRDNKYLHKDNKQKALLVEQINELIKPDGLLNKNMFNGKNLRQFTKHMIQVSLETLNGPNEKKNRINIKQKKELIKLLTKQHTSRVIVKKIKELKKFNIINNKKFSIAACFNIVINSILKKISRFLGFQ